jgi:D-alanyl-D-alanine endopeptidase (penicillin-binding protein 7)
MRKLFSKSLIAAAVLATACSPVFALAPLTAKAWLVADGEGKVIEGNNTTDVRSIASITKLMTVIVTLDAGYPLDEVISTKLYNKNLTRRELISLAIIKSDNNAAKILCEHHNNGTEGCIQAMNLKAWTLDMKDTHYLEPTGLSIFNVSTAADLVKLVMEASKYQIIKEDSNTDTLKISNKKKTALFHNTNTLVGKGYEFIVSKTGWITKSGGCIVMMMNTEKGIRTVVLLGSKNTRTRIPEAKMIALAY